MKEELLTDEKLASEDWRCLFFIMLAMFMLVSAFFLEAEVYSPAKCVPDYCSENFCITLKGSK